MRRAASACPQGAGRASADFTMALLALTRSSRSCAIIMRALPQLQRGSGIASHWIRQTGPVACARMARSFATDSMPPKSTATATLTVEQSFEVLGVACDASEEEIRIAYLALAKEWHPDSGNAADSGAKFAQVHTRGRTRCLMSTHTHKRTNAHTRARTPSHPHTRWWLHGKHAGKASSSCFPLAPVCAHVANAGLSSGCSCLVVSRHCRYQCGRTTRCNTIRPLRAIESVSARAPSRCSSCAQIGEAYRMATQSKGQTPMEEFWAWYTRLVHTIRTLRVF